MRSTMSRISGVMSGLLDIIRSIHCCCIGPVDHLDRDRQDRIDDAADRAGHQADDRPFGGSDLVRRVLLTQIGRQRPADEHPQTAAAIAELTSGSADSTPMNNPPQNAGCSLSDISREYSRPRCVMSSSPRMIAQRVLQLHQLNEQVVLRIQPGRVHRALEVEREPLLDARSCPRASPGRGTARRRARSAPPECCRGRGS